MGVIRYRTEERDRQSDQSMESQSRIALHGATGHPWKTKEMDHGTCYAGLSFYRDKDGDGNVVGAALAHVFARKD